MCTTGNNDVGIKSATGSKDTGKSWEQYQTANTLKWTWRKEIIYMLTLLPKGVQTKYLKHFLHLQECLANVFFLQIFVRTEIVINESV